MPRSADYESIHELQRMPGRSRQEDALICARVLSRIGSMLGGDLGAQIGAQIDASIPQREKIDDQVKGENIGRRRGSQYGSEIADRWAEVICPAIDLSIPRLRNQELENNPPILNRPEVDLLRKVDKEERSSTEREPWSITRKRKIRSF
jgi:hypothetical protein